MFSFAGSSSLLCRVAAASPRHHIRFEAVLLVRSDHALRWPRAWDGDAGGTRTGSAVALSICTLAVGPMFTNDSAAAARHHTPLLAIGPHRCRFIVSDGTRDAICCGAPTISDLS